MKGRFPCIPLVLQNPSNISLSLKAFYIIQSCKNMQNLISSCLGFSQGVWNRREIQLTWTALPYDYTCFADVVLHLYKKYSE